MDQGFFRRTIGVGAIVFFLGLAATPFASADAGQRLTTQSGKLECAVFASYPGTGPNLKVSIPAGSFAMCAPRFGIDDPRPAWPVLGMAVVDSAGDLTFHRIEGPPASGGNLVMRYGQTYNFAGWTIAAGSDGTRFTNDRTGHGMFISFDVIYAF